jgi:hypothetical protein
VLCGKLIPCLFRNNSLVPIGKSQDGSSLFSVDEDSKQERRKRSRGILNPEFALGIAEMLGGGVKRSQK